jgi:glycosyltransferase involved in cell wall biosynthesis
MQPGNPRELLARMNAGPEVQLTAVIGVPVYNGATYISEAVESLLAQTRNDFAIVLVDDASTDETPAIAEHYAEKYERVSSHRNPERIGMVANWRHAFALGRRLHPDATYFAWGSDHDSWHPRWFETLVGEMQGNPEAVLAWPYVECIDGSGRALGLNSPRFDTAGIHSPEVRVERAVERMLAGFMVYGLYSARQLERCGVYRRVLMPDRLLIAQLAVLGEFRQVPEYLWRRRYLSDKRASLARQRRSFFPAGAPLYSYLPWWSMHVALFTDAVMRGELGSELTREVRNDLARRHAAATLRFAIKLRRLRLRRVIRRPWKRLKRRRHRLLKRIERIKHGIGVELRRP